MTDRKQALYRFFSDEGELLYVGITMNPSARWPKHAATKQWWHEIETITVETFDSRAEVLTAEKEAIKTERPTYNIVHAEPVKTEPAPASPEVLYWECSECGDVVAPGEGDLWVSLQEAHDYNDHIQEERAARPSSWSPVNLSRLMAGPEPAEWRATHSYCWDETLSVLEPIYAIAIEEVQTPSQLLGRTAHLLSKTWLRWTAWEEVIRKAVRPNAGGS